MDVGRQYDGDVIRINSQSGKGGIGYLMEQKYGIDMPPEMRESFGYYIKGISDKNHKELMPDEIYAAFKQKYVNNFSVLDVTAAHFKQNGGKTAQITMTVNGREVYGEAHGNGRLDSSSDAIKKALGIEYSINTYYEHALERGSKSKAVAYVGIDTKDGPVWGAGVHEDIIDASINALVSAINNSTLI